MRGRSALLIGLGGIVAGACSASPHSMGFSGSGGAGGDVSTGGSGGGVADAGSDAGRTILPAARSSGCDKTVSQELEKYVEHPITIAGVAANATDRIYYVRLPANYDPSKPYRTVYLGPGCGRPQDSQAAVKVYAVENSSMDQAILIAMEPGQYNRADYSSVNCATTMTCDFCFDDGAYATTADSVEYPYFDALHQAIEADYCVDTNRQFYAGYSSGGWMAQELGCQFPDVLRAQGNVTGGLPPVIRDGIKTCKDHPIAAFLIHDLNDRSNPYAGSVAAVNRLLALNHCAGGSTMDTAPSAPYMIAGVANTATFSCVQYTGCPADYPIVFCTSTDQMHNSQATDAVPGFWGFFSGF